MFVKPVLHPSDAHGPSVAGLDCAWREVGNNPGVVSKILYIGLAVVGVIFTVIGLITGKITKK